MKHYSLKRKLIVFISIPVLFATILVILMSYLFAKHEIEEVYDAQLAHSSKVLLLLTKHQISKDENFDLGSENNQLQHKYERNLGFRIWSSNRLVVQSNISESFIGFEAPPGFSDQKIGKHEWRFFVFLDPESRIKIEVSERYDIRYELIIQLMVSLLVPFLLFIPFLFVIIGFGVRSVLRPVVLVSDQVDNRSTDDLSPVNEHDLPKEIAPLIQALNRLFIRINESLRKEREFTDHAAHELRTPLAAMKTQTQVLIKKAKKTDDTLEGFKNLEASINRATRLVEQLLSLARLQNETLPLDTVNLSDVTKQAYDSFSDLALQKNIRFEKEIQKNILVKGHADTIVILLNNILDNAIKYTPENGSVFLRLDDKAQVQIIDTGTGLSDEDKTRVFDRFVRMDKTGQPGSGLGLSIVKWIAENQSIKITLDDNKPKGLIVNLSFDR